MKEFTSRSSKQLLGALFLSAALLGAALAGLLTLPEQSLLADGPDQADVVAQFEDDSVIVRRVSFSAPISGLKALELSGLDVITADFGGGFIAVCSIDGLGCPADDCFCSPSHFWSYSFWNGMDWEGYPVGAVASSISDGAVEGWRWQSFLTSVPPAKPAPPITAASSGLEWLRAQQSITNGSYGNSMGGAVDALLAIGANGYSASEWRRAPDSPSLLAYTLGNGAAYSNESAAAAGKLSLALAAADSCVPAGVVQASQFYSPTMGAYGPGSGPQSWAMLGVAAISQTIPASATQYLLAMSQPDGGWEWQPGFGSDSNTTALAVQALIAAGEPATSTAVVSGVAYLKSAQNADGGIGYIPGSDSDTNSTAWAVQALSAAGEGPGSGGTLGAFLLSSTRAISYLIGMQLPDGSFEWQPDLGSNMLATQQAIPALLDRPYPIRPADLAFCPAIYLPSVYK